MCVYVYVGGEKFVRRMRIASKVFVTTRKEQNKNTLAVGNSEVD